MKLNIPIKEREKIKQREKLSKENRKDKFNLSLILKAIGLLITLTLAFSFSLKEVKAAQIKTVEFFINQSGHQIASAVKKNLSFSIYIPESNVNVRDAFVEMNGVSLGAATLGVDFNVSNSANTGWVNISIGSAGETQFFTLRQNFSALSPLVKGTNNFTLNSRATGTIVSLLNAKAIVTYEYNESEPVQLKTVKYFVGQNKTTIATLQVGGKNTTTMNFTTCIPEDNPVVRSAFIEITGTSNGAVDMVFHINVSNTGNLILGPGLDGTIATQFYKILYNATALYSQGHGCKDYYLNIRGEGTNHWSIGAMAVLTYEYSKTSSSQQKTVRQFIMQNRSSPASGISIVSDYSLFIPEFAPQMLSAFTYVYGWVGAVDSIFRINISNFSNSNMANTSFDINTEGGDFTYLVNSTTYYSLLTGTNINQRQVVNLTGTTISGFNSEAYLTYNTSTPKKLPQQKTIEQFIVQNNSRVAANVAIRKNFSIYIPEDILNVTSFIIELTGVQTFVTTAIVDLKVNLSNRKQLNYSILNTGETNYFIIKYQASPNFSLNKGWNENFQLNVKYDQSTLDALSAKAIITYNFTDITAPTYSNPEWNDTSVFDGDNVSFNVTWNDNYDLQWYIFSMNYSNGYRNSSKTLFSGNYNVSFNVTNITSPPGTNVSWLWYVNDSNGNLNQTNVSWFIVQGGAPTAQQPKVENVILDDGLINSETIDLLAGIQTQIFCNATIIDYGGDFNNIKTVNATIFLIDEARTDSIDNNSNHYTNKTCTATRNITDSGNYTCGFGIYYYARNGTWGCNVTANMLSGLFNSTNDSATINTLIAINTSPVIDYGNLNLTNSSPNDVTMIIENIGNIVLDLTMSGYGSTQGDNASFTCQIGNITISAERFNLTSGVVYSSMQALINDTNGTFLNINLSRKSNPSIDPTLNIFWKAGIPRTLVRGNCTGAIVVNALSDQCRDSIACV